MNRRDTPKTIGVGAPFGAAAGTATATPGQGGNDSNDPGRVGNYNGERTLVPPNLGGFDRVLLRLADADPFPNWDRVAKAEFLEREIVGRSTAEIFEVRREATDFHRERFGLDFPYPADEDDLFAVVDSRGDTDATVSPGMLNPGRGHTAYVVSGKGTPNTHGDGETNTDANATGKVRDGSWGATLDEDATLGGTMGAGLRNVLTFPPSLDG